jgi:hypothetical protein
MRVGWTVVRCSPAGCAYSDPDDLGARGRGQRGGDDRKDAADGLGDDSMMQ